MLDRLILALRLYTDRGLSYTWRRAWRRAGELKVSS